MKTILCLATLLLASVTTHAQLVKTLFQTFEVPDSATVLTFEVYEQDTFAVVPWAGNTIMTESNIKLYYVSRAVFDHLLEAGRYNFGSRESGDTLALATVEQRRLELKLKPGEEEGDKQRERYAVAQQQQKNEIVEGRIFIPDDFSPAGPGVWKRPRKEQSEERLGAYRPRKKLARESGEVSRELEEAIPDVPQDTVEEKLNLPPLDSIRKSREGRLGKPKKDKQ